MLADGILVQRNRKHNEVLVPTPDGTSLEAAAFAHLLAAGFTYKPVYVWIAVRFRIARAAAMALNQREQYRTHEMQFQLVAFAPMCLRSRNFQPLHSRQ